MSINHSESQLDRPTRTHTDRDKERKGYLLACTDNFFSLHRSPLASKKIDLSSEAIVLSCQHLVWSMFIYVCIKNNFHNFFLDTYIANSVFVFRLF